MNIADKFVSSTTDIEAAIEHLKSMPEAVHNQMPFLGERAV
jgi:hypothetical protein